MAAGQVTALRYGNGVASTWTYDLGSLNVLTTSSGTEVHRLNYRPWGETDTNVGAVDGEASPGAARPR